MDSRAKSWRDISPGRRGEEVRVGEGEWRGRGEKGTCEEEGGREGVGVVGWDGGGEGTVVAVLVLDSQSPARVRPGSVSVGSFV